MAGDKWICFSVFLISGSALFPQPIGYFLLWDSIFSKLPWDIWDLLCSNLLLDSLEHPVLLRLPFGISDTVGHSGLTRPVFVSVS